METNDRIDAYLAGEMTATEKAHFENEMNDKPQLAKAVKMQADLGEAIASEAAAQRLRATLKNIYQEEPTVKTILPLFSWRKIGAIAASLLLLVTIAWVLWLQPKPNEIEQLAQITPVKVFSIERAADITKVTEAANLYSIKQYREAIKVLEECLQQDPLAMDLWLFKGIAEREIGDFMAARRSLEQIIKNENVPNNVQDEARLYEASVYFMEENCAKVKEIILSINTPSYREQGTKIEQMCP